MYIPSNVDDDITQKGNHFFFITRNGLRSDVSLQFLHIAMSFELF